MPNRRHLTDEEKWEIKRLCDSGISQKEVSQRFNRNPATVCYIANDGVKSRPPGKRYVSKTPGFQDIEPEDYSKLPPTVLFNFKNFPSF